MDFFLVWCSKGKFFINFQHAKKEIPSTYKTDKTFRERTAYDSDKRQGQGMIVSSLENQLLRVGFLKT